MNRCAFVVVTDWPSNELSEVGQLTASYTGEAEDHMGVFVPFCTEREIMAHSAPEIGRASANGAKHVSFDYMSDLLPRFQSIYNRNYFTEASRTQFYPILNAPANEVHKVCLDVAEANPRNYCCHRLNSVLWWWPYPCCCCPSQRVVAPSTCVALSARIVAAAATGNQRQALMSDTFVFDALKIPRFSMESPRSPYFLTGYTPRGGARALRDAGVIGAPVDNVDEALRLCKTVGLRTETMAEPLWERPLPLVALERFGQRSA